MGQKRVSKNDPIAVDREDIIHLIAALQDYHETSGTDACVDMNKLIRHIRKVMPIVEAEQREDLFWQTTFPQWYKWMKQDPVKRRAASLLCVDFDDSARAEAFLTCPPLSEQKCARLFSGIDAPENAYEVYAAKAKQQARQMEIMYWENHGPKFRALYRLRVLTGCTECHVKKSLKARHGYTLLKLRENRTHQEAVGNIVECPDLAEFV